MQLSHAVVEILRSQDLKMVADQIPVKIRRVDLNLSTWISVVQQEDPYCKELLTTWTTRQQEKNSWTFRNQHHTKQPQELQETKHIKRQSSQTNLLKIKLKEKPNGRKKRRKTTKTIQPSNQPIDHEGRKEDISIALGN